MIAKLLIFLAERPEVYLRARIMGHLWRTSYSGDPWVCTVHVYNRRRKIEVDPVYPQRVVSVGELGYRFAEA